MTSMGIQQLANKTSVITIVIMMSAGYVSLKSRKGEKVSLIRRDRRMISWILDPTFAQV